MTIGGGVASTNDYLIVNGGSVVNSGALTLGSGAGASSNSVIVTNGGYLQSGAMTIGGGGSTNNWFTVNAGSTSIVASLTISSSARDWSNGVNVIGGTLIVTNSLGTGVLNVGQNGMGILNLTNSGTLFVNQLLVTNNIAGNNTNSTFNFVSGTLITSNAANKIAANIVLYSNQTFNIQGTWNMLGGSNIISGQSTSNTLPGTVYIGTGVSNASVTVGSGAVWSLNNPNALATYSNLNLTIGGSAATGDLLTVNGGAVSNAGAVTIGSATTSAGNKLLITNGGDFFSGAD